MAGPPSTVTWLATPSSAARASMAARSSASTPPVSANTVCTAQPRSCSQGTQKLVSRPPLNARTMSLCWGLGSGDWGLGMFIVFSCSRDGRMGAVGADRLFTSPQPLAPSPPRQRRHHRLLYMQPVLRFLDRDAVGRVHHRVGGLDVAAQRQAVGEDTVAGQRHLGLVDDEVPVAVADRPFGVP